MAIKSDAEIYQVIERHLRESKDPLTCVALWEHADVREHAPSADKVSDFLGLMWRRNLLQRWNTPKNSMDRSRYAYSWIIDPDGDKPQLVAETVPRGRMDVNVTELEDTVVLKFDKFTVTITPK